MGNGARIAEIAMQLGGMDLPEEAKTLVTELIGLASGDDIVEPDAPIRDDKADPVVAAMGDPEADKMYRKLLGDSAVNAMRENAIKIQRAQTVALARTELGDRLTPSDERDIAGMSPAEAAAYVKGLKRGTMSREAPKRQTGISQPKADAVDVSRFLRAGESLDGANGSKRVAVEILETRATLARQAPQLPRGRN